MSKEGKAFKRMGLCEFSGTPKVLFKEYLKRLEKMSLHQFNKIGQMKNFKEVLGNLQIGQVIFVHHFSQNLLLINQDEVASAHWDHEQVTIHPMVCFYVCKKCGKVVKEELIHLSEDKHHNVIAVAVFQNKSIEHLHSKGIKVEDIIEFTD